MGRPVAKINLEKWRNLNGMNRCIVILCKLRGWERRIVERHLISLQTVINSGEKEQFIIEGNLYGNTSHGSVLPGGRLLIIINDIMRCSDLGSCKCNEPHLGTAHKRT